MRFWILHIPGLVLAPKLLLLDPLSGVPLTQLYAFNLGIYPQLAHEGLSGGKERHSHLWRDLKDEYTVSCFLGISIFSLAVDKADASNLDSILQT